MNYDQMINNMAHQFGMSRKEVLNVLKQMSKMPSVQEELQKIKEGNHKKKT